MTQPESVTNAPQVQPRAHASECNYLKTLKCLHKMKIRGPHSSDILSTFAHTDLHRSFYTQTLLHTEAFTHKHVYTQRLLHTDTFTHRHFYMQKLRHTDAFTHRRCYTQTLLHTDAFTHRRCYTQTPLHTDALTHKHF